MGPTCQAVGQLLRTNKGQSGLVDPDAFRRVAPGQQLDRTTKVDGH